jgi:TRAP-type transport system small permease protein
MLAIDRFFKYLTSFLKVICLSLVLALAVLTFIKVIFRYVLNSPIVWSDEIIMLMLLTLTYFGAALAANDRSHINVDLMESLFNKIGYKALRYYHLFIDIVFMSIISVVIVYGFKICIFSSDQVTDILNISYFWVYLILPISLIFILLMILKRIWEEFSMNPGREN